MPMGDSAWIFWWARNFGCRRTGAWAWRLSSSTARPRIESPPWNDGPRLVAACCSRPPTTDARRHRARRPRAAIVDRRSLPIHSRRTMAPDSQSGLRAVARVMAAARPEAARDAGWGYVIVGAICLASTLAAGGCSGKSGSPDAAADVANTDVPELGGGGHGTCPTTLHGPALVRASWKGGVPFCIDSTEVTNAQYQEFLAAAAPP